MPSFDSIVIGLGATGSAAVYHLARRGQRVLGLDRYSPPHTFGSSHGGSRIIRKAYFEGDIYLPMLERAYDLWQELEAVSGRTLLHRTGGLTMGARTSAVVTGAKQSAARHHLAHEMLTATAVRRRFPAFHLPDEHVALWEPDAGFLNPEVCIQTHLEEARRQGGTLRFNEPVLAWDTDGLGIRVMTPHHSYDAERLVMCAGGWTKELLPDLDVPLHIERQINGWFSVPSREELFAPTRCPVYIWAYEPDGVLYGVPDLGDGVKAGLHHHGQCVAHPDALDRILTDADEQPLRQQICRLLPDLKGSRLRMATCFYTNTPDKHYLIDRHPEHQQVVFASACSGHGFKVSSALGEILTELVLDRHTQLDIHPFRRERF